MMSAVIVEIPADGADQAVEALKRLDHHLDPFGQRLDCGGVSIDQVQLPPDEERMVLAEPTRESFGQFRDLGPQPAIGQISQPSRISIATDESVEHRTSRDTHRERG